MPLETIVWFPVLLDNNKESKVIYDLLLFYNDLNVYVLCFLAFDFEAKLRLQKIIIDYGIFSASTFFSFLISYVTYCEIEIILYEKAPLIFF